MSFSSHFSTYWIDSIFRNNVTVSGGYISDFIEALHIPNFSKDVRLDTWDTSFIRILLATFTTFHIPQLHLMKLFQPPHFSIFPRNFTITDSDSSLSNLFHWVKVKESLGLFKSFLTFIIFPSQRFYCELIFFDSTLKYPHEPARLLQQTRKTNSR